MTSPSTNDYGLGRRIPASIKRQVRQECGFGCVICGHAVAQYDHFEPPFESAREHRPEGIVYICGACHDKKSRGIWSDEKVAAARWDPITFQKGCARDVFDIQAPFTLAIGYSTFENVATIVKTREGEEWLTILPPVRDGAPMRVSVRFFDDDDQPSLTIDNNEWIVSLGQWDTEVEGRTITVRRNARDIALKISTNPPHGLTLERLRMRKGDLAIQIEPSGQVMVSRGGGTTTLADGCLCANVRTVFIV